VFNRVTQFIRKSALGALWGCLSIAVPLVGYMINGSAMRYSGDDYCYASVLAKLGFWKAQAVSYSQPQAYNGNRYSLTLFSDISSLFGTKMGGALPLLAIMLWSVGIFLVIRNLVNSSRINLHWLETLFLGEVLVFFVLYMAPSLPQILYWRSGMLPYLAPLVANTFLVFFLIYFSHVKGRAIPGMLLIGLTSLLAGGFSEAATVVQLGYITFMLIGMLLLWKSKVVWLPHALRSVLVAWLFSLVAFLLLAFSPANLNYLNSLPRPFFLSFISITVNSGITFLKVSVTSVSLPSLILFIFSMAFSWLIFTNQGGLVKLSPLQWSKTSFVLAIMSMVLITSCMAPSAYIQSSYPELRTLVVARFIMVLALALEGGVTGLLIANTLRFSPKVAQTFRIGVVALLILLSIFPIYAARDIYSEIPKYQRWASFWDTRDEVIRLASQNNVNNVQVMKLDHIIPNVSELSEDPRYWYNMCASWYYGVQSIRADLPGWDAP
jgi:hypothetical protein